MSPADDRSLAAHALQHLDALHVVARGLAGDAAAAEALLLDVIGEVTATPAAGGDPRLALLARLYAAHASRAVRGSGTAADAARPAAPAREALDDPLPGITAGAPTPTNPTEALDRLEALRLSSAPREAIESAVAELPAPERVALVLRHALGLRYAEIAEVMGVPEGTVRARLERARRAVRRRLLAYR